VLKTGKDPEVWITQLEDICVRLERMGSGILERQFMIHVLNNLTSDYDVQVALLERRIGDVEQPLTAIEISAELSLRFERIKFQIKIMVRIRKKWRFMAVNLNVNADFEIAERLGTSRSNVKIEEIKMAVITVVKRLEEFFIIIARSRDMPSKTVSNLRKGTHESTITNLTLVTVTQVIVIEKTKSHKIWFSQ
jgi:hypothetical protein